MAWGRKAREKTLQIAQQQRLDITLASGDESMHILDLSKVFRFSLDQLYERSLETPPKVYLPP